MRTRVKIDRNHGENFSPSVRELRDGVWEAYERLPVVGDVSVTGRTWQEAKMALWLISEAVAIFAEKQCKPCSEWSEEEWRRTLGKMREIYEQSPTTTGPTTKPLG